MIKGVEIDQELLEKARVAGGHATREEALIKALQFYVQRLKQAQAAKEDARTDAPPDSPSE